MSDFEFRLDAKGNDSDPQLGVSLNDFASRLEVNASGILKSKEIHKHWACILTRLVPRLLLPRTRKVGLRALHAQDVYQRVWQGTPSPNQYKCVRSYHLCRLGRSLLTLGRHSNFHSSGFQLRPARFFTLGSLPLPGAGQIRG